MALGGIVGFAAGQPLYARTATAGSGLRVGFGESFMSLSTSWAPKNQADPYCDSEGYSSIYCSWFEWVYLDKFLRFDMLAI